MEADATWRTAALTRAETPACERFRDWILRAALPFWADRGVDPTGAGFEEQLTLAGERDGVAFKRVRVQARQIYVYSHAALLGWTPGLDIARRGYDFLMSAQRGPDGGWPSRLDRRGGVSDASADLYDIAFVMFALAWHARASGSAAPIAEAHRTLDWLEAHMASPSGGFFNSLPRRDEPRRQNPHMHLLEAALALYETSDEPRFLALARRIVGLFRNHFFESASGALGEFFQEDWTVVPGPDGDRVEPGHHYEWVWLLARYQATTGEDVAAPMRALYDFANRWGADPRSGLVMAAVNRRGGIIDPSSRIWPQTEAIKAHVTMARLGDGALSGPAPPAAADRQVGALFDRFLDRGATGAWSDHLDGDGRLLSEFIPASTLYHLFGAYAEMAEPLNPQTERPLGATPLGVEGWRDRRQ